MTITLGKTLPPGDHMAKKRSGAEKKRTPPNRTGEALNVWLSPQHAKNMHKFLNQSEFKITKTSFVEQLIEKYLKEIGVWEE